MPSSILFPLLFLLFIFCTPYYFVFYFDSINTTLSQLSAPKVPSQTVDHGYGWDDHGDSHVNSLGSYCQQHRNGHERNGHGR